MENKRRKQHNDIECVPVGFANGTAREVPLTTREKERMIKKAEVAYGKSI